MILALNAYDRPFRALLVREPGKDMILVRGNDDFPGDGRHEFPLNELVQLLADHDVAGRDIRTVVITGKPLHAFMAFIESSLLPPTPGGMVGFAKAMPHYFGHGLRFFSKLGQALHHHPEILYTPSSRAAAFGAGLLSEPGPYLFWRWRSDGDCGVLVDRESGMVSLIAHGNNVLRRFNDISSQEALARAGDRPPKCVILDHHLANSDWSDIGIRTDSATLELFGSILYAFSSMPDSQIPSALIKASLAGFLASAADAPWNRSGKLYLQTISGIQ
ncbi:MAG: hypothetical protein H7841_00445 [Magnetospirillum sp. WYHS-4]